MDIAISLAVLVVVLLVWNSGIFQKNATAATIGDDKLSVAELSFYYYDVRQMYAQYGMIDSSMNDAETVLNSAEGTTYQDYFLEQALSDAQRYHVLYEDALKEGRTAADVKDSVDAQIANLKASAKAYGYDYKADYERLDHIALGVRQNHHEDIEHACEGCERQELVAGKEYRKHESDGNEEKADN